MANIDESITIAVDAMGGDHAPSEIVTGAVEAAKRHNVNIFLVGDPDQVKTELDKHEIGNLSIKVIPSEADDETLPASSLNHTYTVRA